MNRLFFILIFGFVGIFSNIKAQSMRVMSYNIRLDLASDSLNSWTHRKASFFSLIDFYQPEIFGVQEALPDQMTDISQTLKQYRFVGVGRDDGNNKGEYSAIFYDTTLYKVIIENTFWLSETPEKPSLGWDAAYKRICSYALFETKIGGKQFWVFNTHFDHIGVQARQNSALLVLKKIEELNAANLPLIFMGDLNSAAQSKSVALLSEKMHDAYLISQKKPYGPIGTFNAFDAQKIVNERIDYIFISGFDVDNYMHIDDKRNDNYFISDHLPVLATLTLK
jgi:endonuclease/exonuclease/phosphatase family metal-dependent hydrolase